MDFEKVNDQTMEGVVGGISQDEALAAALKHVGLEKTQLDYIKEIELDWERGRKIYEISFFKDGFEYEFDIDAASGRILKFEKDRD